MGVEGSVADDHPSVVVLNGLQIEDVQYVCLCRDSWPHIDQYCLGSDSLRISKLWGCIRAAKKYRTSRDAMLSLSDPFAVPDWSDTLPVLKADDIRGLSDALIGETEGTRRPSWIWTTNTGILTGSVDMTGNEGMCSLSLQAVHI